MHTRDTSYRKLLPNPSTLLRMQIMVVILASTLLLGWCKPAMADPPNGVDHLLGRWDGVIENLNGTDQPFTLLLTGFTPASNDSTAALAGGCLSIGGGTMFTPLAARAVNLGDEAFDITIVGTTAHDGETSIIRLTGVTQTVGPSVPDDAANGGWVTAEGKGNWSAKHHDRRHPECPAVHLGDGLAFSADVYAGVVINPDGSQSAGTLLESRTNIVSSAVRVTLPDGNLHLIPLFTDIFSPSVNFLNAFRFLGNLDGFPVAGGTYTFTLLDVQGQPIAGATAKDAWLACTVGAPRHVSATIEPGDGILVRWEPVSPAPGFDPGGVPSVGFYQIELAPENGGNGSYGANAIKVTSHLIPLLSFGGVASGSPDGMDFGNALEELADGTYGFNVIAFAVAPALSIARGLECQIRAAGERVRFEKSVNAFNILP